MCVVCECVCACVWPCVHGVCGEYVCGMGGLDGTGRGMGVVVTADK